MDSVNPLIGKIIKAVYLADDSQAIKFELEDGQNAVARCDGECCSRTWIENVEDPEALIDSPVLSAGDTSYRSESDGELKCYGFNISTVKGTCSLDYRNASNGYYGGSLVWPEESYFYGGVFNQNVSKEVWEKLA